MEEIKKPVDKPRLGSFLNRVDPLILALLIALAVLVAVIGIQKPNVFFLPKNF